MPWCFRTAWARATWRPGAPGWLGHVFRCGGLIRGSFGASGYLFEQMLAAHPGPAARAAIEKLATADQAATAKALASGSPGDLFVYTVTDQQLVEARPAIAHDGGDRIGSLFDALAETCAIYLGQNTDGFASNRQRALLMKRTLMRYLNQSAKPARVLFKFGDLSCCRSREHQDKVFLELEDALLSDNPFDFRCTQSNSGCTMSAAKSLARWPR